MAKQTPLYERHLKLGAKMTEFAGFDMPLRFAGIIPEVAAVRERAGLFDICHMGEIEIRGARATDVVQRVSTNDVERLPLGKAQYSVMCREDGGIIDDILTYRRAEDRLLMVVNAGNRHKDFGWVHEAAAGRAEVVHLSDQRALLALQGPSAEAALQQLTDDDLSEIGRYWAAEVTLLGDVWALASRTGYAGEDGFEVYTTPTDVGRIWDAILQTGVEHGVEPCGLGARDVLRLEAGLCLYGQDISEETNPIEAGLEWVVKCEKTKPFIGQEVLCALKARGPRQRLVGITLDSKRIARHGAPVLHDGERIGVVTSGTYSPSLQRPIGLAYVRIEHAREGTPVQVAIDARGETQPGEVVNKRFLDKLNATS